MGFISNQRMRIFIELLIETAMRRGELASLDSSNIDQGNGTLEIKDTKTGYDREIFLSGYAMELFRLLTVWISWGTILPMLEIMYAKRERVYKTMGYELTVIN